MTSKHKECKSAKNQKVEVGHQELKTGIFPINA